MRTEASVRAFNGLNVREAAGEHVTTAYLVVWPGMVLESPPTGVNFRAQWPLVAEQLWMVYLYTLVQKPPCAINQAGVGAEMAEGKVPDGAGALSCLVLLLLRSQDLVQ